MSVVIHSNFKHLLSHFMEYYQTSQESLGVPLSKLFKDTIPCRILVAMAPKRKTFRNLAHLPPPPPPPPLPNFTGILGCSPFKVVQRYNSMQNSGCHGNQKEIFRNLATPPPPPPPPQVLGLDLKIIWWKLS